MNYTFFIRAFSLASRISSFLCVIECLISRILKSSTIRNEKMQRSTASGLRRASANKLMGFFSVVISAKTVSLSSSSRDRAAAAAETGSAPLET